MTITTLTASTIATPELDAPGLLARVASILNRLYGAYHNRRAVAVLATVGDHMLADIGLTRRDVSDAFAEPVWRDPTILMQDRAQGRRRAQ